MERTFTQSDIRKILQEYLIPSDGVCRCGGCGYGSCICNVVDDAVESLLTSLADRFEVDLCVIDE